MVAGEKESGGISINDIIESESLLPNQETKIEGSLELTKKGGKSSGLNMAKTMGQGNNTADTNPGITQAQHKPVETHEGVLVFGGKEATIKKLTWKRRARESNETHSMKTFNSPNSEPGYDWGLEPD
ncbi:hypothetical protein ACOSQ2_012403 [Xanthoceras sorbifolium]